MSVLDDIRMDLVNESASLANILRKAKILASAMGVQEFRDWVDSELSGYADRSKIPDYRRFHALNYGTYSGPFQSWAENVVLPVYNLPEDIREFAEHLTFVQGVGELEAMLVQSGESYALNWPQEYVLLARDSTRLSGGMVLVAAHKTIPQHMISGVLDNVKNKLLDFILGLQENDFTPERFERGAVEQEIVRNLFNVNIYGDHNVVSSGESVHQQIGKVEVGNLESLMKYFRELGLNEATLSELRSAISSEPEVSNGEYGPRIRHWIGGVFSRGAKSTWKAGLDVSSKVLMDALNKYYGLL